MSAERGFTPIREVNSENVRFDVELPEFLNEDEIGVNVRNIETLLRIGGIEHLRVVSLPSEETAGKTRTRSVSTHHSNLRYDHAHEDAEEPHEYHFANIGITLNMSEISQRIEKDNTF